MITPVIRQKAGSSLKGAGDPVAGVNAPGATPCAEMIVVFASLSSESFSHVCATASLDAKSEHEVFQRFAELTRGRMAMLISHRFSTVRMADRIFVLQGGRIAEEGPHAQLMQNGGRYAEMFELQAASYR